VLGIYLSLVNRNESRLRTRTNQVVVKVIVDVSDELLCRKGLEDDESDDEEAEIVEKRVKKGSWAPQKKVNRRHELEVADARIQHKDRE
jgi:hypothetical protein